MALKGELKTVPLTDVLQLLSNGLKTGILHIRSSKGISKKVYFENGKIMSTASSDPREYLGQFLISRGLITEKQLNMAMETQFQSGIKLGKILVMASILEENEIQEMLKLKAEESLYDIFLWENGEFYFEEMEKLNEDIVPISLDVTSLIFEGIRRKDEKARFSQKIPTTLVVLKRKVETSQLNEQLDGLQFRLFEEIDGERSLEEIALHLHSTEFNISLAAYVLLTKNLVEIIGEKQSHQEASINTVQSRLVSEAKKMVKEEKYGEAINVLKFYLRSNKDTSAEKLLREVESKYSQNFLKEVVSGDSVLELNTKIEDLPKYNLTPKEGFLATRINGIYTVSQLLKISPMPEIEVLSSIKKLLDLGIAKIKGENN